MRKGKAKRHHKKTMHHRRVESPRWYGIDVHHIGLGVAAIGAVLALIIARGSM